MLWRRKARTALTFASIAVAFMLFGLLQAFATLFASGAKLAAADSLITAHRYGFLKTLPYAYRSQIAALPGVRLVDPVLFMPFIYEEGGTTTQPSLAIDPTLFAADPRIVAAPGAQKAFEQTRTGMIAGRALAEKYHWKIGDHIPLKSAFVKRRDGADHWEFDLVGLFDYNEAMGGKGASAMRVFVRYDYIDQTSLKPGEVNMYYVKINDPAQAPTVSKTIDALFQNSANPSKTLSEAEQQREQIAQIGDIGLIITAILSAVFFTLIVVAGNTMMRAVRERIPELAVLKTLGYTDRTVAWLVASESLLLCLTAGLAGLAVAYLQTKALAPTLATIFPFFAMAPQTVAVGAALALGLGLIAAIIPAWQSARLSIVDGLARR